MNALESIILFSLIPNCLLRMYRVLIRFAMYCYGLLVPKNKCLRRCGLIWKRQQHTFGGVANGKCETARPRDQRFSLRARDILTFSIARPRLQSVLSASARRSDSFLAPDLVESYENELE